MKKRITKKLVGSKWKRGTGAAVVMCFTFYQAVQKIECFFLLFVCFKVLSYVVMWLAIFLHPTKRYKVGMMRIIFSPTSKSCFSLQQFESGKAQPLLSCSDLVDIRMVTCMLPMFFSFFLFLRSNYLYSIFSIIVGSKIRQNRLFLISN